MRLTVKAAVGAALFAAASMSAFATTVTPPASGPAPVPGLAPGGLMVEVYDTTTGISMTEWLGGDISTFGTPASTPAAGLTLDYGILGGSTFASTFSAAEIAAGNVIFTVTAANDINPGVPTVDSTISQLGLLRNGALVNVAASENSGISGVFNAPSGCNSVNPCVALSTTAAGYAANYFSATGNGAYGTTTNAGGIAGGAGVAFYQLAASSSTPTGLINKAQFGNATGTATWTLSAAGDLVQRPKRQPVGDRGLIQPGAVRPQQSHPESLGEFLGLTDLLAQVGPAMYQHGIRRRLDPTVDEERLQGTDHGAEGVAPVLHGQGEGSPDQGHVGGDGDGHTLWKFRRCQRSIQAGRNKPGFSNNCEPLFHLLAHHNGQEWKSFSDCGAGRPKRQHRFFRPGDGHGLEYDQRRW